VWWQSGTGARLATSTWYAGSSPLTPLLVTSSFRKAAAAASSAVGSPWAFAAATLVVLVWAAMGPAFHYSDTWQLVINTGTTVVTFLMVFLIQNTQNREARVTQLKLDELIRAVAGARNSLVDMEHMSDDELARLQSEFEALRDQAAVHRKQRRRESR
jgi:low affinity Fe/Cu permease